jgi:hypothetical protein
MPETRVAMATMLSVTPNDNQLEVRFRDSQNNVHCINVPAGALGGLITALRSQAAAMQGGAGQPMTLDSGQMFG